MNYIYQRIAKPINYRDIIGEIAGEDFPDQDEWNVERWKKYYQDDYDWHLQQAETQDDNYAILDDSDNKFAPNNNHDDVEITRLVNSDDDE